MAKSFQLEIVTPRGLVWEGQARHLRAPGIGGSFGVLADHSPMISPLQVGVIEVDKAEGDDLVIATSGGVAEVHGDHTVVLAETAENYDSIDVARAEQAKKRAEERLARALESDAEETIDMDRARIALLRAINRIRVAARAQF